LALFGFLSILLGSRHSSERRTAAHNSLYADSEPLDQVGSKETRLERTIARVAAGDVSIRLHQRAARQSARANAEGATLGFVVLNF
jgi:hypothetical protein